MRQADAEILPDGAKARRVYLAIRDQIANGSLADGDPLPAEQKLAEEYQVSRVTVRRALDALAAGGMIVRRAGSGTKVRTTAEQGAQATMDFTTLMPQLVEMGRTTTARLLSFTYGTAPGYVGQAMALPPETRVQIAARVRSAEGKPFSHLTTYVPERIARNYSENDLATTPLFKLLERSGVQIESAHQTVSASLAAPDVAEALNIAVGAALLAVRRVVRDVDGNGVEFLSGLYRPDMFRLEMPLARVGHGSARHWEPAIGHMDEAAE